MELKMNQYQLPEKVSFNFDELKQEVSEKLSFYEAAIYSDDQIKQAKTDRANLNKLKKALNDERIKCEKEYMKPFIEFKTQIDEIIKLIDKPIAAIDSQIKAVEEHEKAEKLEKIKELWESIEHPAEMQFEHVFKEKFLNKSCSMGTITQYFKDDVDRFKRDMSTLQNLPEFSFEAVEVYKQTLDINKAISEGKRLAEIQKRKEEAERQKAEAEAKMEESMHKLAEAAKQTGTTIVEAANKISEGLTTEPLKMWVSFKALMTTEDGFALKDFFNSRGIEFESI